MKLVSILLLFLPAIVLGQASPKRDTSVTIEGKTITVRYSAPSVKGRNMLGAGGRVSQDPTYPVWRLGADAATALHTDGTLELEDLKVPPGDYTLFAQIDSNPWMLIVSKQTGQWGLAYKKDLDLGRTAMKMSRPAAPVETLKITLEAAGGNKGTLTVEFENTVASVGFTVR